MKTYTHGADPLKAMAYQQRTGKPLLDLSANVNPLGMPKRAEAALKEAVESGAFTGYPDPYCLTLTGAIAEKFGVEQKQILCGNGAADLIFKLCAHYRPKRALIVEPTFSEYEQALLQSGCERIDYHMLQAPDYIADERLLDRICPVYDVLFCCTPNNPTGRCIPDALLLRILQRCRECGVLLIVDECFLDFTGVKSALIGALSEGGVVLLRAFTKFYGMAGLRLGFLLAERRIVEELESCGQPWAVSAPAQIAGAAALCDEAYERQTLSLIQIERKRLFDGIKAAGYAVLPGEANFLFFHAEEDLGERLMEKGIILRSCENYPGLASGDYRVAVRKAAENIRFLNALADLRGEREDG